MKYLKVSDARPPVVANWGSISSFVGSESDAAAVCLLYRIADEEAEKLDGNTLEGVGWRVALLSVENRCTDVVSVYVGMGNARLYADPWCS